jgi:hypothetical protein
MTTRRFRTVTVTAALALACSLGLTGLTSAAGAATAAPRPSRPAPEVEQHDTDVPTESREVRLRRYGELRFTVDSTVAPSRPTVDPLEGTREPRPVGAVVMPNGATSEVILDEVVVHTSSQADLDAFLSRWNAAVLQSDDADQADDGRDALVRVDPTNADVANLPTNLLTIEPEHVGEHRMSSERTLQLWALAAQEAAAGVEISLNTLGNTDSIVDGQVFEQPASGNVFGWSYMRGGGTQDVGVAPAWQLLEAKHRLNEPINVMIQDGGFVRSDDWPGLYEIHETSEGTPNGATCSGKPCPWHGSTTVSTLMGEADNDFGAAGPAGPLNARLRAVGMDPGVWTMYKELQKNAEAFHPHVVNMSYGTPFYSFKWASEQAANRRFKKANAAGALLVASAGNANITVDSDDLILPCESWRVMCVGAQDTNSIKRAPYSNYGLGDSQTSVEIYAPGCVNDISDPSNPESPQNVKTSCGTSEASPLVAGIAAMVRAANPTLNQSQVRALLNQTAHVGGLGPEVTGSQRRVDAMEAVAAALNVKLDGPKLTIGSPKAGKYPLGHLFEFSASATDYRSYVIPVQWKSDRDGQIGSLSTQKQFSELSVGKHVLTVSTTDFNGESASKSVNVEVVDEPATVAIQSPVKNKTYSADAAITLAGTSVDPDTSSPVPNGDVSWVVKRNGSDLFGTIGHDGILPANLVQAGDYTVTFKATGGGSATRSFKVAALPPGESPPTATITEPDHNVTLFTPNAKPVAITFKGKGTDFEDGNLSGTRFRWVAYGSKTTKVLCTGSSVPGGVGNIKGFNQSTNCSTVNTTLGLEDSMIGDTVWTVQLEVFDSSKVSATDTVKVTVRYVVP